MKYTTQAFKAKVIEIIRQFEKDYPRPAVQQEAEPYKRNLQQQLAQCNTSILLFISLHKEMNKMPYWFSKVGYLVIALREFLKENNYRACLACDEYEKAVLEAKNKAYVTVSPVQGHIYDNEQLQKEQAKNEACLDTIIQLEAEKRVLVEKLNAEVLKGLGYRQRVEALLNRQATQNTEEIELKVLDELQQFTTEVMEENNRLITDLTLINTKYLEAVENNRKLQTQCDDLDKRYNELETKFNAQHRLLNNKIKLAQTDTQKLRDNLELRIMSLENQQAGNFRNHRASAYNLPKSSPINTVSTKQNKVKSTTHAQQLNLNGKKLSL